MLAPTLAPGDSGALSLPSLAGSSDLGAGLVKLVCGGEISFGLFHVSTRGADRFGGDEGLAEFDDHDSVGGAGGVTGFVSTLDASSTCGAATSPHPVSTDFEGAGDTLPHPADLTADDLTSI